LRRVRFHDLRHCYASLLIHNNESPKRIQSLLGHSKVTFDIYGHLMRDINDGVADRLAELALGPAPGSKTVAHGEEEGIGATQVSDLLVARDGIEPPTRGFSVSFLRR
jgi:hypothetical protein